MDIERKQRECSECGCNVFTVRKSRDLDSVFQKTGNVMNICVDCLSNNSQWVLSDSRDVKCSEMDRMQKRNERLQKDNNRMRKWMDEHFQRAIDENARKGGK